MIGHRILVTVTNYVIHFIITINVIASLKYRVFMLLNSGLSFSGLPISCHDFLVCLFQICYFPPFVLFWSANFRSAIFSRPSCVYVPSRTASLPLGRYPIIYCLLTEAHFPKVVAQHCLTHCRLKALVFNTFSFCTGIHAYPLLLAVQARVLEFDHSVFGS